MAYLLDSDTFILAKNTHYGMAFCPGYWEWIIRENERGAVFSIDSVYNELCKQKDELTEWAKARGTALFLPMDMETNAQMVRASNHVNATPSPTKRIEITRFLKGADPLLLACALAHGHTIVTHEVYVAAPNFAGVKIPNVCKHFGVRCIPPHQMLNELGASFGLLPKRAAISPEPTDLPEEEELDENDW